MLLVVLICTVTAAIGAVHTRIFGHDLFIFLDAGWRVLNGQRPEIDFNPSMGALLSLLAAAGLKLAHNSPDGVGYMSALVGGIAGCGAYALSRRQMTAVPAMLAGAVVVLIAVGPYPIGFAPNLLSHAMIYNRYGYALLGLIVLECFQEGDGTFAGGLSTGVVSAALLFLKPSYALVAIGFAGCSFVVQRPRLRRAFGLGIGLVAAGIAMMAYLRFDFAALWSDLRLMSAARSSGLSLWNVRWALFKGLGDLLPLSLLALLVASVTATVRPLLVTALVWVGGALLLASNAQPSGFPLNAVLAVLLIEQGRRAAGAASFPVPGFPRPQALLILLGLVCYAPTAAGNASGLVYAWADSRANPTVARFSSPRLAKLVLFDIADGTDADQRSNGRAYVDYVNDGVALLERNALPKETIFTLDMANPFTYALARRPAEGGAPALSINHTFNDRSKPTPEWLFGSADIVMVPKRPASSGPDADALFRNYLPAIEDRFRICAESDWWKAYRRR